MYTYQPAPAVTMMPHAPVAMSTLPVPADHLTQQPQQPNIANPVFSNAVTDDLNIRPYSQQILWALANELVGSVTRYQTSPLRIFTYNLLSANGFNNQEFFQLGQLVAGRVKLGLMRQEYPNIEVAISALVPDSLSIMIGANGRRFEELLRYCTPKQQQDALAAANAYDNIVMEINRIAYAPSSQIGAQPMQGNVTGQASGHGHSSNAFSNIGSTGTVHHSATPVAVAMPARDPSTMTALERQAYETAVEAANAKANAISGNHLLSQYTPATAPVVSSSNLSGQYSVNPVISEGPIEQQPLQAPQNCSVVHVGANAPAPQAVSPEVFAQQVQMAFAPEPQESPEAVFNFKRVQIKTRPEDVQTARTVQKTDEEGRLSYVITIKGEQHQIRTAHEFGEVQWKPSALQPHHPLVSLNVQRLFYVELVTGEILAMVKDLEEGKYHMDYDKHALYADLNDTAPVAPSGKPVQKPVYHDREVPKMKVFNSSEALTAFSVESAVSELFLSSVGSFSQENEDALAATYAARVLTPVYMATKHQADAVREALENVGACPNFESASETLAAIDDERVRAIVNRLITARINDAFKFELSVTYNAIDSFMDDFGDLLNVINENYPGAIAETFNSHQSRIIRSACYVADNDKIDNLHDYFGVNADQCKALSARTVFIARNISVAVCNFNSEDLNAFFTTTSSAVLETTHPHLREILNRALNVSGVPNRTLTQVNIITLDGVRFLASNSMVAQGSVLIRRV